jgi:hypothetical protein
MLLILPACTGDEDGTDEHVHEVNVEITTAPPASVAAGEAFDVTWEVINETHDDLHHSEIRVCDGAGVDDCGMGEQGTYTSVTGTMTDGVFTATVMFDMAGSYTLVAWAHVGDNPHVSDLYDIEVQ